MPWRNNWAASLAAVCRPPGLAERLKRPMPAVDTLAAVGPAETLRLVAALALSNSVASVLGCANMPGPVELEPGPLALGKVSGSVEQRPGPLVLGNTPGHVELGRPRLPNPA